MKKVSSKKSESTADMKEKAALAVSLLKEIYPDALCSLEWNGEPWRLLIMGRLSAQCTDAKVNIVCRELFSLYPTAKALSEAEISDIERIIRPCGLYKVKAKNIKDECLMLVNDYCGVLPNTMEGLLAFPGVGRKIANLILGDIYHMPAVVADTHCIRICGRLGFYPEEMKDPVKVEKIMSQYLEPSEQSDFCHRIVLFGREYCKSQSPRCENCPLSSICSHTAKKE